MKNKKRSWDDVRWTPFGPIDAPGDELPNNRLWAEQGLAKWYANSIYVVRLIALRAPSPFGLVMCLTVRTHDHQPRHDWRELQRIKNELVGDTTEAVEVYPSEDRLVDNSNYYHLFCFPELATEDGWLPFGFTERLVIEGSGETGRQRDFRPEIRPEDVFHRNAVSSYAVVAGPNDKVAGRCAQDGSAIVFRAGCETTQTVNGKVVSMLRGECQRKGHLVLVAAKTDLDDVEEGSTDPPVAALERSSSKASDREAAQ
ncbi:MAG TPA: hypothetical protein VIV57_06590 [Anaeromyxobacter sp.]